MACSSAGAATPDSYSGAKSAPSSVVSSPVHYPAQVMAGAGGAIARRANLEFPPPPPYPPPHKANGAVAGATSAENPDYRLYYHKALVHHAPRDYSYAYNGAHSSRTSSPIGCSAALVRLAQQHPQEYQLIQQHQEYQLLQAQQQQEQYQLLQAAADIGECSGAEGQQQKNYQMVQAYQLHRIKSDPHKRHTYVTRYGTEENIYEEISEIR